MCLVARGSMLTRWGWDKMAAIYQTTFSNAFSWMKMYKFRLRFHWSFFFQINNIPAMVQIMAWHWPEDKLLSEPMMVSLLTHICITRPLWVNSLWPNDAIWQHGSMSTLVQVMACCLTAPSRYLNQCWLISKVQWHSSDSNFRRLSTTNH